MNHTYASVGRSGMYVTREPSSLCLNDIVWVVEGDLDAPMNFSLADCFVYTSAEHPPFPTSYARFKFRVLGHRSLLKAAVPLSKADAWFAKLHSEYITKQKFFHPLASEPDVIKGLQHVSGITF